MPATKIEASFPFNLSDAGKVMACRRRENLYADLFLSPFSPFVSFLYSLFSLISARGEIWRRTFTGISTGYLFSRSAADTRRNFSLIGKNHFHPLPGTKISDDNTQVSKLYASSKKSGKPPQAPPLLNSVEVHKKDRNVKSKADAMLEPEQNITQATRSIEPSSLALLVNHETHQNSITVEPVLNKVTEVLPPIRQAPSATSLRRFHRSSTLPGRKSQAPTMPYLIPFIRLPPLSPYSQNFLASATEKLGFLFLGLAHFVSLVGPYWSISKSKGPSYAPTRPRSVFISILNVSVAWLRRCNTSNDRGLCSRFGSPSAQRSLDYHPTDLKKSKFLTTGDSFNTPPTTRIIVTASILPVSLSISTIIKPSTSSRMGLVLLFLLMGFMSPLSIITSLRLFYGHRYIREWSHKFTLSHSRIPAPSVSSDRRCIIVCKPLSEASDPRYQPSSWRGHERTFPPTLSFTENAFKRSKVFKTSRAFTLVCSLLMAGKRRFDLISTISEVFSKKLPVFINDLNRYSILLLHFISYVSSEFLLFDKSPPFVIRF